MSVTQKNKATAGGVDAAGEDANLWLLWRRCHCLLTLREHTEQENISVSTLHDDKRHRTALEHSAEWMGELWYVHPQTLLKQIKEPWMIFGNKMFGKK